MKKALKITAITIATIFVLLIAAIIILPKYYQNELVSVILKQVNKTLYAEISIEDFDLTVIKNFPNPTLKMENVLVTNKVYFEGDTLAKLGKFDACFDLWSIINGDYHLKKAIIDDALINVKFTEDSLHSFNWDIMIPDTLQVVEDTVIDDGEEFHINIKTDVITITNADIHYSDVPFEMFMDFEDLNLSFNGNLSDTVSDIKIEMDSKAVDFDLFQIPLLSKANVKINTEVTADLNNWKFAFCENEILLNNLALELEGFVAIPDDIEMDLKLKLKNSEFKNVLSMIPAIYAKDFADIKTSGQVALNAFMKGKMTDDLFPAFGANLSIANAMFQYPDLPASVSNINIIAKVNNNTGVIDHTVVDLPKCHLQIIENPFDLTAHLETPISDPNIDLTAKGIINLNDIKKIYPFDETTDINGNFKIDLAVKTLLSYIENEEYNKVDANGNLEIENLTLKNTDILNKDLLIPIAKLEFTPKYINLEKFETKIGKNDLSISGKVEEYLPFVLSDSADLIANVNVKSNYINVAELLSQPIANSSDTISNETTTDTTSSMLIIEVPKFLNVNAGLAINTLIYDNIELKNANLLLTAAKSRVNIKKLSADIFEGKFDMSGYYETPTKDWANADLNININKVSPKNIVKTFGLFKKYMPVMEHAEGLVSFNVKAKTVFIETMTPNYQSTNMEAKLGLIDFRLVDVESLKKIAEILKMDRYKSFALKNTNLLFKIIDGKLISNPFKFNIDKTKFEVEEGYIGLDKSLKYNTFMEIPKSYMGIKANEMISQMQSKAKAAGITVNESEFIKLNLKIGGTIDNPSFDLGLKEMKDQLKEEIKEIVTEKVKETVNKALDEAEIQAKKLIEEAKKQSDKLVAEAKKQKDKLVAEARKQADALVKAEKEAGDKIIAKAKDEADKMIKAAKNPIEKKAKEIAAKKLIDEAEKKAKQANKETKTQADKLVSEAQKEGDAVIAKAQKEGDKLIDTAKTKGDNLIENARKKAS